MFYFRCNESKIYESFTFWNKLQEKNNFCSTMYYVALPQQPPTAHKHSAAEFCTGKHHSHILQKMYKTSLSNGC